MVLLPFLDLRLPDTPLNLCAWGDTNSEFRRAGAELVLNDVNPHIKYNDVTIPLEEYEGLYFLKCLPNDGKGSPLPADDPRQTHEDLSLIHI